MRTQEEECLWLLADVDIRGYEENGIVSNAFGEKTVPVCKSVAWFCVGRPRCQCIGCRCRVSVLFLHY
jgi:hypothetical protein